MPSSSPTPLTLLQDGERMMRICNACRYCEGFCAVFPAMERRLYFNESDLNYLANLCHDCGECYYSCQYAPPHEFVLNLPKVLAEIRRESYEKYAWPGWFAGLFQRSGLMFVISAVLAPVLLFVLLQSAVPGEVLFGAHSVEEGSFYQVMPHQTMVAVFGAAGLFAFLALVAGFLRFWHETGEPFATLLRPSIVGRAVSDVMRLRYLHGGGAEGSEGGAGCAYPSEVPSHARKTFHHLTYYGFLLCFASTSVAATYHNVFGWHAPYPWLSLPVVLGIIGGTGLLVGPLGLYWLKGKRDTELTDPSQARMDVGLLALLFLTSLTGFLLLVYRESSAMGVLLAIHLGVVMGLLLTLPYSKFVHAVYRFGALLRNAAEERRLRGRN